MGVGEIASVNKAGQVLRNLENVADLAKMTKARRLKTLFPEEWDKLKALTPLPDNFWTKLDELGEAQGRFLADFDAQQLQHFVENPNLVDSWKVLDDANVPAVLKRDPVRLGQVDNYLTKNPGTESAITKGLDDVGDYKEEFLNGIQNATEDLSNLNGRSALPDEIADAVTKIKQHRNTVGNQNSGNYGYLEGNVGTQNLTGNIIRSGPKDENMSEIFDAVEVNSQQVIEGPGAWLRNTDSEYKMLNRLANDLNVVKGGRYPDVTGTLKIISERPYCPSCQGVIQQFNEMFPNVNLILVDGVR